MQYNKILRFEQRSLSVLIILNLFQRSNFSRAAWNVNEFKDFISLPLCPAHDKFDIRASELQAYNRMQNK